MGRIGMTVDQLLVATWGAATRPTYAAHVAGLNVLRGETIALIGSGAGEVLAALTDALPRCTVIEGAAAAPAGTLRIHAQQAARVGVEALAITDPFGDIDEGARALAVADLAGLKSLGVTTVVALGDVDLAAAFADRVAVVRDGVVVVAYPVVAPTPRSTTEIAPVAQRVTARLSSTV
ncbi:MAG: hypothetical protein GEU74_02920 [Nitriliruptorales bacterium]|nr:hypothetical protein [Nitriliruptorales bacterium]